MARKLKLAVFDIDGKATLRSYPVSDSGDRIRVKKGGEGHFMPQFDHTSFIELARPWYKGGGSERIYFARKGAKKCVNFKTGVVGDPDPELVKIAAGSTMLKDLGKEKQEMTWQTWMMLGILILLLLYQMGVIV